MYANLSIWNLTAIIVLSMLIGFWAGLGGRKKEQEDEMLSVAGLGTVQGGVGLMLGDASGAVLRNISGGIFRNAPGTASGNAPDAALRNAPRDIAGATLRDAPGDAPGTALGNAPGAALRDASDTAPGDISGAILGNMPGATSENVKYTLRGRAGNLSGNNRSIISGSDRVVTSGRKDAGSGTVRELTPGNRNRKVKGKKADRHMGSPSGVKPKGWAIGSPAAGEVSSFREGSKRGVLIRPDQGKIFAPVSGKVVKLYPTGNAFRLRTDLGVELLLQAGTRTEELEGLYYRPRVVQNEIVGKGRLLLEYDVEGIRGEGYDADIVMSVEDVNIYHNITMTESKRIKPGEDLMWVGK